MALSNTHKIILTLVPSSGVFVERAAADAIDLARTFGAPVWLAFNETIVEVSATDTPIEVGKRWYTAREEKAGPPR